MRLLVVVLLVVLGGIGVAAALAADGRGVVGRDDPARDDPADDLAPASAAEPVERPAPTVTDPPQEAVVVEPGDDLQSLVEAYPEGTRFELVEGTFRGISVIPRDGQRFSGRGPETIVSGAVVLAAEDFEREGDAWYVDGQEQGGGLDGPMLPGRELDAHAEEVFVDGSTRLRHVGSVDELDDGSFHFDYDADRIYVGADPSSFALIETSVLPFAFAGTGVRGVVVEDLTVEKYASENQYAALGGDASTRFTVDWTYEDVEVRDNHAGGILAGPGTTVRRAHVHRNGQQGIAGNGSNLFNQGGGEFLEGRITVEDSEIAHNRVLGFDWQHEGGGTKFSLLTEGMTFQRNHVHDNGGPGIWLDVYNEDSTIVANLVEDNEADGIFYEISFGDTVIEGNTVLRNGLPEGRAGIHVSGSEGVVVRNNLVADNGGGIEVLHDGRRYREMLDEGWEYPTPVRDVTVVGNEVRIAEGRHGMRVLDDADRWYDTIRFEDNTYEIVGQDVRWSWLGVDDAEGWFAAHPEDGPVVESLPADVDVPDADGDLEGRYGPRR